MAILLLAISHSPEIVCGACCGRPAEARRRSEGRRAGRAAQAMCEMLTIVGKRLEEAAKNKARLEGYFAVLERWAKSRALPSRTKFMIRDILDLRRSKWVPRRQKDQARRPRPPRPAARETAGSVVTAL